MTFSRMVGLALAGVALIVVSAGGAELWLDAKLEAGARERALLQLTAAHREVEHAREAELRLRARMLAADTAASAYIADALAVAATPGQSIDTASISDLLGERREQLGLDAIGVIDTSGRWIAGTRPWTDSGGAPVRHPLYLRARDQQQLALGLVRNEQRIYLAAIQPMGRGGSIDAYWYAASELNLEFVAAVAALAPVDLALLATAPPQQLLAPPATLGEDRWWELASALGNTPITAPTAAEAGAALVLPVYAGAGESLLLARPRAVDSEVTEIRVVLYALAAIWSLLWLGALSWWWRSTLAPIGTACDLLERAALGDFHLRAPAWPGGVRGRFASAFDALMLRLGSR